MVSKQYVSFMDILRKAKHTGLCERMLTPGVGLGDVPLIACSHMTFRCGLLEQQNGNK